ncbi:MAG: hypothetical protein AMJ95_02135 [Omnitrophica WOR_2 bacterium SM23_72]|nr:MAG: hypothetical protein AMJ95_02135 [Omnitrophica WOR_2 bacterium SM23_72]
MEKKEWQEYSEIFKELLGLEYSPVALNCLKEPAIESDEKKLRICRTILDAGKGATLQISRNNNACFGASWHLGFQEMKDPKVQAMVKKFVVEGEKLFCSYPALDKLISQMEPPPDNTRSFFLLSPMEKANVQPQLVIFVVNPEAACRLLTFVTFLDGVMPKIKIGGPICRLGIIYPLVTGEVNLSFYDYTARKMCNVEKDKLIISIPYVKIPPIIESIDKCSAGRAKIEFPAEFREFLQKRLSPSKP